MAHYSDFAPGNSAEFDMLDLSQKYMAIANDDHYILGHRAMLERNNAF